MVQYFHNASLFVTGSITIPIATGKARGKTKANVAIANNQPGSIATCNVTMLGQGSVDQETINPGKIGTYTGVSIDDLFISVSTPATLLVDIRWPDVYPVQDLLVSTDIGTGQPEVIDPRQTRFQSLGDTPLPYGSRLVALQQDEEGNLLHNQAAVSSNGGVTVVETGTISVTSVQTVYTVGADTTARLLSVAFSQATGSSATLSVGVERANGSPDYIIPSAGTSVGSGVTWTAGQGPGNNAQLPAGGFLMLPGDELTVASTKEPYSFWWTLLQEPL